MQLLLELLQFLNPVFLEIYSYQNLPTVFAEFTELTLLCDRPTRFYKCDAQAVGEK